MTDGVAERLFPTMLEPLPTRDEARELLGDDGVARARRAAARHDAAPSASPTRWCAASSGPTGSSGRSRRCTASRSSRTAASSTTSSAARGGCRSAGWARSRAALERAARDGRRARSAAAPRSCSIDGGDGDVARPRRRASTSSRPGTCWRTSRRRCSTGCAAASRARPPRAAQTKVNLLLDAAAARCGRGSRPRTRSPGRSGCTSARTSSRTRGRRRRAASCPTPRRPSCTATRSPTRRSSPTGRHTLTLFGLHTPASLFRTDNAGVARRARRALPRPARRARSTSRSATCLARDADGRPCIEARSPLDLEAELGLPAGNIFHGDLSWPWREDETRAAGASRPTTSASSSAARARSAAAASAASAATTPRWPCSSR